MRSSEKALIGALRQYKHNDSRAGFVFGYNHKLANEVVFELQDEIKALKVENKRIREALIVIGESASQSLAAHNKAVLIDLVRNMGFASELVEQEIIDYANDKYGEGK